MLQTLQQSILCYIDLDLMQNIKVAKLETYDNSMMIVSILRFILDEVCEEKTKFTGMSACARYLR